MAGLRIAVLLAATLTASMARAGPAERGKVAPVGVQAMSSAAKLAAARAAGLPVDVKVLPPPLLVSPRSPVAPGIDMWFDRTAAVRPKDNYAMLDLPGAFVQVDFSYTPGAIYLADCAVETSKTMKVDIDNMPQAFKVTAQHLLFALPPKAASPSMKRSFRVYGVVDQIIAFHGCELTNVK